MGGRFHYEVKRISICHFSIFWVMVPFVVPFPFFFWQVSEAYFWWVSFFFFYSLLL